MRERKNLFGWVAQFDFFFCMRKFHYNMNWLKTMGRCNSDSLCPTMAEPLQFIYWLTDGALKWHLRRYEKGPLGRCAYGILWILVHLQLLISVIWWVELENMQLLYKNKMLAGSRCSTMFSLHIFCGLF